MSHPDIKALLLEKLRDSLREDGVPEDRVEQTAQELMELARERAQLLKSEHDPKPKHDTVLHDTVLHDTVLHVRAGGFGLFASGCPACEGS